MSLYKSSGVILLLIYIFHCSVVIGLVQFSSLRIRFIVDEVSDIEDVVSMHSIPA